MTAAGSFSFEFDNAVVMQNNIENWTNQNEGAEYFFFEIIPGSTEWYIENQESYRYSWHVKEVTETTVQI